MVNNMVVLGHILEDFNQCIEYCEPGLIVISKPLGLLSILILLVNGSKF